MNILFSCNVGHVGSTLGDLVRSGRRLKRNICNILQRTEGHCDTKLCLFVSKVSNKKIQFKEPSFWLLKKLCNFRIYGHFINSVNCSSDIVSELNQIVNTHERHAGWKCDMCQWNMYVLHTCTWTESSEFALAELSMAKTCFTLTILAGFYLKYYKSSGHIIL